MELAGPLCCDLLVGGVRHRPDKLVRPGAGEQGEQQLPPDEVRKIGAAGSCCPHRPRCAPLPGFADASGITGRNAEVTVLVVLAAGVNYLHICHTLH